MCGRVCGYAHLRKNKGWGWLSLHAVLPAISCILASQSGGWWGAVERCHPLTKDTDIEQDKTLTFHQHLSCAPLFFSPFLFFLLTWWWHSPELWHTQSVLGGSATSQRHTHMATGDRAKWAEERYLSSLHVVEEPWAACFNPGHSSLLQPLNIVFLLPQTPLSYGSFNDLCYAVWNTRTGRNTECLSWNHSLVFGGTAWVEFWVFVFFLNTF